MHESEQVVVLQHMRADLSLDSIELLLEHRDLLDRLEVQAQLVPSEPIDLEVTHQQHDQLHQEFVHLQVLLHPLQLLRRLFLVALQTAPEACEHALLARVELHQLQLQILFVAFQVLELLLIVVLHLVSLQECLHFPLFLLEIEVQLLKLQVSHEFFQLGHEARQPLVVGLVEDELALRDLVAVDRQAGLLVLGEDVVEQHCELFGVGVFGLDEAEGHFLEVLNERLVTPRTGRIFLM